MVGTIVKYTCNVHTKIVRTSECSSDGTWTPVTKKCPVFVNIGATFQPSATKPVAYITSQSGYPNTFYLPWLNRNWYFKTFKGCFPKVSFIGSIFDVKGKNNCAEDYVIIQQWRRHNNVFKVKKCGVYNNPALIGTTTAKWDDKNIKIHLRTNKPTNASGKGKGFMALVSYEHCY